ncbi:MAG: acyl transferase [Bacteroidota bacterium]
MKRSVLQERIKTLKDQDFEDLALAAFRLQANQNLVYRQYLDLLGVKQTEVSRLSDIPFLPIQLFKQHHIQTGDWEPQQVFSSSATTGSVSSKHWVRDLEWYRHNARKGFEHFYGPLDQFTILALLPSYLERSGSSLILMAEDFIQQSDPERGGFYLYEQEALLQQIEKVSHETDKRILLLGVSFALLDLAETYPQALPPDTIVMETGGMKGRRKELTRSELHQTIKTAFQLTDIHSEYGMTELFSQAYSQGNGVFYPAPSMRVYTREITDPLCLRKDAKTGVLNIIDLANLDTISFIATEDLGKVYPDESFEVLGRLDASEIRGCNLMVV